MSHSDSVISVNGEAGRQQAFVSSQMRSSCRRSSPRKCCMKRKKKNKGFTCSLPLTSPVFCCFFVFSFFPRGFHISFLCTTATHLQQNASFCLNYHWWCDKRIESQQIMFTSRTELIKASLGCCDAPFLYLRLMVHVMSVLSPSMCCFPSRRGYLEYRAWAICRAMCVRAIGFFK